MNEKERGSPTCSSRMHTPQPLPNHALGRAGAETALCACATESAATRPAVLKAPADLRLPHLYGASGPFVAGGQRVDVGIVEESVVAVPPRVGLRADAEMVVRDELGALMVARVQPGVEGAEGHARESQHEGQEAPGASCSGDRQG